MDTSGDREKERDVACDMINSHMNDMICNAIHYMLRSSKYSKTFTMKQLTTELYFNLTLLFAMHEDNPEFALISIKILSSDLIEKSSTSEDLESWLANYIHISRQTVIKLENFLMHQSRGEIVTVPADLIGPVRKLKKHAQKDVVLKNIAKDGDLLKEITMSSIFKEVVGTYKDFFKTKINSAMNYALERTAYSNSNCCFLGDMNDFMIYCLMFYIALIKDDISLLLLLTAILKDRDESPCTTDADIVKITDIVAVMKRNFRFIDEEVRHVPALVCELELVEQLDVPQNLWNLMTSMIAKSQASNTQNSIQDDEDANLEDDDVLSLRSAPSPEIIEIDSADDADDEEDDDDVVYLGTILRSERRSNGENSPLNNCLPVSVQGTTCLCQQRLLAANRSFGQGNNASCGDDCQETQEQPVTIEGVPGPSRVRARISRPLSGGISSGVEKTLVRMSASPASPESGSTAPSESEDERAIEGDIASLKFVKFLSKKLYEVDSREEENPAVHVSMAELEAILRGVRASGKTSTVEEDLKRLRDNMKKTVGRKPKKKVSVCEGGGPSNAMEGTTRSSLSERIPPISESIPTRPEISETVRSLFRASLADMKPLSVPLKRLSYAELRRRGIQTTAKPEDFQIRSSGTKSQTCAESSSANEKTDATRIPSPEPGLSLEITHTLSLFPDNHSSKESDNETSTNEDLSRRLSVLSETSVEPSPRRGAKKPRGHRSQVPDDTSKAEISPVVTYASTDLSFGLPDTQKSKRTRTSSSSSTPNNSKVRGQNRKSETSTTMATASTQVPPDLPDAKKSKRSRSSSSSKVPDQSNKAEASPASSSTDVSTKSKRSRSSSSSKVPVQKSKAEASPATSTSTDISSELGDTKRSLRSRSLSSSTLNNTKAPAKRNSKSAEPSRVLPASSDKLKETSVSDEVSEKKPPKKPRGRPTSSKAHNQKQVVPEDASSKPQEQPIVSKDTASASVQLQAKKPPEISLPSEPSTSKTPAKRPRGRPKARPSIPQVKTMVPEKASKPAETPAASKDTASASVEPTSSKTQAKRSRGRSKVRSPIPEIKMLVPEEVSKTAEQQTASKDTASASDEPPSKKPAEISLPPEPNSSKTPVKRSRGQSRARSPIHEIKKVGPEEVSIPTEQPNTSMDTASASDESSAKKPAEMSLPEASSSKAPTKRPRGRSRARSPIHEIKKMVPEEVCIQTEQNTASMDTASASDDPPAKKPPDISFPPEPTSSKTPVKRSRGQSRACSPIHKLKKMVPEEVSIPTEQPKASVDTASALDGPPAKKPPEISLPPEPTSSKTPVKRSRGRRRARSPIPEIKKMVPEEVSIPTEQNPASKETASASDEPSAKKPAEMLLPESSSSIPLAERSRGLSRDPRMDLRSRARSPIPEIKKVGPEEVSIPTEQPNTSKDTASASDESSAKKPEISLPPEPTSIKTPVKRSRGRSRVRSPIPEIKKMVPEEVSIPTEQSTAPMDTASASDEPSAKKPALISLSEASSSNALAEKSRGRSRDPRMDQSSRGCSPIPEIKKVVPEEGSKSQELPTASEDATSRSLAKRPRGRSKARSPIPEIRKVVAEEDLKSEEQPKNSSKDATSASDEPQAKKPAEMSLTPAPSSSKTPAKRSRGRSKARSLIPEMKEVVPDEVSKPAKQLMASKDTASVSDEFPAKKPAEISLPPEPSSSKTLAKRPRGRPKARSTIPQIKTVVPEEASKPGEPPTASKDTTASHEPPPRKSTRPRVPPKTRSPEPEIKKKRDAESCTPIKKGSVASPDSFPRIVLTPTRKTKRRLKTPSSSKACINKFCLRLDISSPSSPEPYESDTETSYTPPHRAETSHCIPSYTPPPHAQGSHNEPGRGHIALFQDNIPKSAPSTTSTASPRKDKSSSEQHVCASNQLPATPRFATNQQLRTPTTSTTNAAPSHVVLSINIASLRKDSSASDIPATPRLAASRQIKTPTPSTTSTVAPSSHVVLAISSAASPRKETCTAVNCPSNQLPAPSFVANRQLKALTTSTTTAAATSHVVQAPTAASMRKDKVSRASDQIPGIPRLVPCQQVRTTTTSTATAAATSHVVAVPTPASSRKDKSAAVSTTSDQMIPGISRLLPNQQATAAATSHVVVAPTAATSRNDKVSRASIPIPGIPRLVPCLQVRTTTTSTTSPAPSSHVVQATNTAVPRKDKSTAELPVVNNAPLQLPPISNLVANRQIKTPAGSKKPRMNRSNAKLSPTKKTDAVADHSADQNTEPKSASEDGAKIPPSILERIVQGPAQPSFMPGLSEKLAELQKHPSLYYLKANTIIEKASDASSRPKTKASLKWMESRTDSVQTNTTSKDTTPTSTVHPSENIGPKDNLPTSLLPPPESIGPKVMVEPVNGGPPIQTENQETVPSEGRSLEQVDPSDDDQFLLHDFEEEGIDIDAYVNEVTVDADGEPVLEENVDQRYKPITDAVTCSTPTKASGVSNNDSAELELADINPTIHLAIEDASTTPNENVNNATVQPLAHAPNHVMKIITEDGVIPVSRVMTENGGAPQTLTNEENVLTINAGAVNGKDPVLETIEVVIDNGEAVEKTVVHVKDSEVGRKLLELINGGMISSEAAKEVLLEIQENVSTNFLPSNPEGHNQQGCSKIFTIEVPENNNDAAVVESQVYYEAVPESDRNAEPIVIVEEPVTTEIVQGYPPTYQQQLNTSISSVDAAVDQIERDINAVLNSDDDDSELVEVTIPEYVEETPNPRQPLLQLNPDDNGIRDTKKIRNTQPSLPRAGFTGNRTRPRRTRANETPISRGIGYELDPRVDGLDPNVRLLDAARIGDVRKLRDCIDRGVEIDVEDSHGKTALHYAAFNNRLECVEYLLMKKARINACDARGLTPMHLAARNAHVKIVRALISNGAAIDPIDVSGMTPLQYAASRGFNSVVHALLLQGANPEHRNNDGLNAVQIAAIANKVKTIEFLSSYNVRHTK